MVSLLRLSLLQFLLLSILKVSFLKHKAERITILFKMFSDSPLPTKFHNLEFKTLHYLFQSIMPTTSLTLPPVESAIPIQLSFIQLQFLFKFTLSQKAPSASAPDGEIQESRDCVLILDSVYEPYWVQSTIIKDILLLSYLILTTTL